MRSSLAHGRLSALAVLLCLVSASAPARSAALAPRPSRAAAVATASPERPLPLRFEENVGQTDGRARFVARGAGATAFLTPSAAVLRLRAPEGEAAIGLRVDGAARDAELVGEDELPGRSNYFVGNDPERWRTNVRAYARVRARGVLPGVDVVYYGDDRGLEYDVVVAPGADASRVRIAVDGASGVRVDEAGDLVISAGSTEIVHRRPSVYQQEADGTHRPVAGRYRTIDASTVGVDVASHDAAKPLVIDPVVVFGTSLGGTFADSAADVATDAAGDVVVTGSTAALDFPADAGQPVGAGGGLDAFVTKLDPSGTTVLFSTYIGGNGDDVALGLAISPAGYIWIAGRTGSNDLPVVSAVQSTLHGTQPTAVDAFVARLDVIGSVLEACTYYGGSGYDEARGIAIDPAAGVYVTGVTQGTLPVGAGFDQTYNGGLNDAFVVKLTGLASAIAYRTYLGTDYEDAGNAIAVDALGSAYVVGSHSAYANYGATAFPTTNAAQPEFGGNQDAFVTKLSPSGRDLIYSTSLGGRDVDAAYGIAVDATGAAYVTGETSSYDFPGVSAARTLGGATDAFLTKISASGSSFVYSTVLGGAGADSSRTVAVDAAGRAFVAGETRSADFPTMDAYQPALGGSSDGFVSAFSAAGDLASSTYLGGDGIDSCSGVAVDVTGAIVAVGLTRSTAFPGGPQLGTRGLTDAFVFKLYAAGHGAAPEAPVGAAASALTSASIALTWTDASASETCFKIERRRADAGAWIQVGVAPAGATSLTDAGLDGGTLYTYRVRASNGPDDSEPSNEASATTAAAGGTPQSPILPRARAIDVSHVVVEWVDTASTETGFEVERRTGTSGTFALVGSAGANAIRFVDATVPGPGSYTYRVRAVNAFGGSGYQQTSAVTVTASALAPPTSLHTTPTAAASVQLAWTDASSGETELEIERKDGAAGAWRLVGVAPANATGFYDARLSAGVTYVYRVTATRGSERSAPSAELSATTPRVGTPGTPFVTGATATSISMRFTASGTITAGYLLERKTGLGGTYAQVGSRIFSSYYTDTGLLPNTVYVYRVRAFAGNETDGYVESSYSTERVVTTPTAPPPGATVLVTSAADVDARDGEMTLREAILVVDGTLAVGSLTPAEQTLVTGTPAPQSSNRIAFAIAGGGPQTIALAGPLPTVTGIVNIDATTQPGYAGTPLVELSGASAGAAVSGLTIASAAGVAIRGFAIEQFSANGVDATNAPGIVIEACYVGTDATGTLARGNGQDGIHLISCDAAAVRHCVASANPGAGIKISESYNVVVAANRVGTNAAGTAALGNGVGLDLAVSFAGDGQPYVGGLSPSDGNLVSGNLGAGIIAGGASMFVGQNVVGLDATGTFAIGNGGDGIVVNGYSNAVAACVVSGNGGSGIVLNFHDNWVEGCFVGTNAAATAAIGNGGDGVLVVGDNQRIGAFPGGRPNVIGGNAGHGIYVSDVSSTYTLIIGNFIGTDPTARLDFGQGGDGVRIAGGQGNLLGAGLPGSGSTIAFNHGNGVTILGGATGLQWNSIYANRGIGIDLGGDGPTPNDPGDGDQGPNDLQNAPVLGSATYVADDTTLSVTGALDAAPSTNYVLEIYAVRPAAAGGASLLGVSYVTTDADGHAAFELDTTTGVPNGTSVVATASTLAITTAPADTSELSAPAFVSGRRIGTDTVGVYAGETGVFFAKNANAAGAADLLFGYGPAGGALVPLSGDWDGDGTDSPGVYDPATSAFFLRNSSSPGPADLAFVFGAAGAGIVPLVGDWDGDGVDSVGFYVPSTGVFFLKNANAPGPANSIFTYGAPDSGVVPLAGDWNDSGYDTVGLYQPATGAFFLRNPVTPGFNDLVFTFGSGGAGRTPVVGDWNGDGIDSVGLYVPETGTWFLKNANRAGAADALFAYGPPGLVPVVGDWDGR